MKIKAFIISPVGYEYNDENYTRTGLNDPIQIVFDEKEAKRICKEQNKQGNLHDLDEENADKNGIPYTVGEFCPDGVDWDDRDFDND